MRQQEWLRKLGSWPSALAPGRALGLQAFGE